MSEFLQQSSKIAAEFELTAEHVRLATAHLVRQLTIGLEDPAATSMQIPSFVTDIPDGSEKDVYLAADLGGTNFRVSFIQLHGDSTYSSKQTKAAIPEDLLTGVSWKPLFSFLAAQIYRFLQAQDNSYSSPNDRHSQPHVRLGFTFSFTVHQTSINTGTLSRWDKGFDIPSAVGQDPCQMLQEALDALAAPVLVVALANDAVATYMAQQYACRGQAVLGAIFGTGTNGAYLEELANVTKVHGKARSLLSSPQSRIVINTEWGAFDDDAQLLPITQYDLDLDRCTLNTSEQRFEKMLSGMYLGELFRRAVYHARKNTFDQPISPLNEFSPLCEPWQIPTSLLSVLAEDSSDGHARSRNALQAALRAGSLTSEEVQGMRTIARAISTRAARLAGIAISAVLIKTNSLKKPSPRIRPAAKPAATLIKAPEPAGNESRLARICRPLSAFLVRLWICLADLPRCVRHDSKDDTSGLVYIGLDGTLAALLPGFNAGIRSTFRDIPAIGEKGDKRIHIALVQDGSSVGTALIAHAAERQA